MDYMVLDLLLIEVIAAVGYTSALFANLATIPTREGYRRAYRERGLEPDEAEIEKFMKMDFGDVLDH